MLLVLAVIAVAVIAALNAAVYYYKPITRYAPWLRNYLDLICGVAGGMFFGSIITNLEQGASLMTLGLNVIALACLIAFVVMMHGRENRRIQ